MRVVIEGPDGGGKTSLAAELAARYGATVTHAGPPTLVATVAGDVARYLEQLFGCRHVNYEFDDAPAVCDRWALGETVYGPLLRGLSLITPTTWRALRDVLDVTNTPLVLCLPPREAALANWEARAKAGGELIDTRALAEAAYDAYASWALNPGVWARPRWTYIYDYTRPGELASLCEFLDGLKERQ